MMDATVQPVFIDEEIARQPAGLAAILLHDRLPYRAHIAAGAERLAALAPDQHRLHRRVGFPRRELWVQFPDHLQGQRVQRLWAIQRDDANAPLDREGNVLLLIV